MTNLVCDTCSVQTNKEAWAKYPDMLDLCKMCKSFQEAISNTIEEHKKVLDQASRVSQKLEKRFK